MFAEISKFFDTEFPLNKHGLEELFALFKVEHHPKGTILLTSGTAERKLRFLNQGVVREYFFNGEKEVNINFYAKPQFISDLLTFFQNATTTKNQESLSSIQVLSIDRQSFFDLLEKYECGKTFIESSFRKLLKQKELREYHRITKTPDELYKDLFEFKPEWLQFVPQYHLASYLNITPETLSRIRKRIS
ncbi:MAG: Crp/Fnr family transcriptional regulator [Cytophagales bacterium]|nr:Crp/Fnr family transcriptional regulator [Cytophagales bacterium]